MFMASGRPAAATERAVGPFLVAPYPPIGLHVLRHPGAFGGDPSRRRSTRADVVLPAGTAATDYNDKPMILFGDMRKAVTFGSRRDTTLKVDGSRYLEFDQVAVMGTERYDINVHDLGDNTDAGPLVALIGSSA